MSSLTELPELIGFFSYSREDDEDSHGALSALRNRVQGELRGQLGRTAKTFRLWQDKEAIPSGSLWEAEIRNAVGQSVFFIPIITPTVVASPHCKFELESFIAREVELGRDDLIFPILYIDVPNLADSAARENDPVLSLVARRQYVDWRKLRHHDIRATDVSEAVERFCMHIRDAMRKNWLSPEERKRQEEAAALQRAQERRRREEAEAQARAREAESRIQEAEARQRAEAVARSKREAEEARANAERQRMVPVTPAEDALNAEQAPTGSTHRSAENDDVAPAAAQSKRDLTRFIAFLEPLTYPKVAMIGFVAGLVATSASRAGLRALSLGFSLGDTPLLSANRAVYVLTLFVPFATVLRKQSLVKSAIVFLALYLGETFFSALTVTEDTAFNDIWQGALSMLLEWLYMAAVFLSLADPVMILFAAAGGALIGAFNSIFDNVSAGDFITNSVDFAASALILAYGMHRQTKDGGRMKPPVWLKKMWPQRGPR